MKLGIVIPAYQAGRHLRGVVQRLLASLDATGDANDAVVIIVNDGSSDDTAAVADALSREIACVQSIDRPLNGGYGAAMKDGLARARAAGSEVVACVHADGQYSPEALPGLLQERTQRDLDLLQGSRILGGGALAGGMPRYKYVANALLNRIENWTLGLSMTDYHSGYLIYGPHVLHAVAFERLSDSFDFDLEVIAAARAGRLRIGEAPIPTRYADEVSHLQPATYGLRVLRVLWRYHRGVYAR